MPIRKADTRLVTLLLLALVVSWGTYHLSKRVTMVQYLELRTYDWNMASLPHQRPDARIVLIGMDDATLDHLPLARPIYPLPRTFHARMVDTLREAGAKVIGFDVMFTSSIPAEDGAFAAALSRQQAVGNKVVGAALPENIEKNGVETNTFTVPTAALLPHLRPVSILVTPRIGKVRSFKPYPVDVGSTQRYLHMAVALAASWFGEADQAPTERSGSYFTGTSFGLGRITAPLDDRQEAQIRYIGPPGSFRFVPYYQVWDGSWKHRGDLGPDFFRGKIVLIGTHTPLVDWQDTPDGYMQGMEILANATQTALHDTWISPWPPGLNILAAMLLCVLLALATWKLGSRLALQVALIEAVLWFFFSFELFYHRHIWANISHPIIALATTYAVASALEARRMRMVFQRFMPSEVADRMLISAANTAASTREVEASVVFCDIRNFTTLSETLDSDSLDRLLHNYFTAGEDAAMHLGTELDKFVGDEIMLYFQERRGHGDHALRAVLWAIAMQEAAGAIDKSGLAGEIGFRVGVGIATGRVRLGTVGARQRIQHTVIGDAVNVASRLQGASKTVGRGIVMSSTTMERVTEQVEVEPLGEIAVKGKTQELKIYYPLRLRPSVEPAQRKRK